MKKFKRYGGDGPRFVREDFLPNLIESPVTGYSPTEKVYYSPKALKMMQRYEVLIPMVWWQSHLGKSGITRWLAQPVLGMSDQQWNAQTSVLYNKIGLINFSYCSGTACPIYSVGMYTLTQYEFRGGYGTKGFPYFLAVLYKPRVDPCWPFEKEGPYDDDYDDPPIYQAYKTLSICKKKSEAGEVEAMYMDEFGSPTKLDIEQSRLFDPRGCAVVPSARRWKELQDLVSWVRQS